MVGLSLGAQEAVPNAASAEMNPRNLIRFAPA